MNQLLTAAYNFSFNFESQTPNDESETYAASETYTANAATIMSFDNLPSLEVMSRQDGFPVFAMEVENDQRNNRVLGYNNRLLEFQLKQSRLREKQHLEQLGELQKEFELKGSDLQLVLDSVLEMKMILGELCEYMCVYGEYEEIKQIIPLLKRGCGTTQGKLLNLKIYDFIDTIKIISKVIKEIIPRTEDESIISATESCPL
tara:strand:+ start:129 stop:737 length:609 start_codon:yes stop_codon:yes gene_type:complete